MARRDEYVFGPNHSIHVNGHYVGGWAFGRKRREPPVQTSSPGPPSLHHRAMRTAVIVIAVLLGGDILGTAWTNGAEIAWAALGALILAAAGVTAAIARRRRGGTAALAASPQRHAIAADEREALQHQLTQTQAILADVLLAAREREREGR